MRKVSICLILLLMVSSASAASVGIAPSVVDEGQIDRGETIETTYYVTVRGYDQPITVEPEYSDPLTSNIFGSSSLVEPSEFSEEDISSWVSFSQDSYEINPNSTEVYTLPDGSSVRAQGEITMSLEVPQDAEPGYHAGSIELNPERVSGSSIGSSTRGVSVPQFMFRVPGNADRNIEFLGAEALRTGDNQVQIIKEFRNTGSVTVGLRGGRVNILDDENYKIADTSVDSVKLAPGETAQVSSMWADSELEGGVYELDGTVNYMTGEAYLGDTFSFTDAIQERVQINNSDSDSETEEGGMPVWMVVMFIVLLGAVLYGLEIDPLWVILLTGLFGISAFVIVMDLPIYLIALTLIIGVGLISYGI